MIVNINRLYFLLLPNMSNKTNLFISTRVHLTKKWEKEIEWQLKADLFDEFNKQLQILMQNLKNELHTSVIAEKQNQIKETDIVHEQIQAHSAEIAQELQQQIYAKLLNRTFTITSSRTITESNKHSLKSS